MPDTLIAPHQAIARLRPRVDAERASLTLNRSPDERLRRWIRLADGAIVGLTHLARICVDVEGRSAIAPLALVAIGQYGARRCDPCSSLELQYLLPEGRQRFERSSRIIAFMRMGLAELGFAHRDAVGTGVECASMAAGDPAAAERFASARFLSGQYGLYLGFMETLHRTVTPCSSQSAPGLWKRHA